MAFRAHLVAKRAAEAREQVRSATRRRDRNANPSASPTTRGAFHQPVAACCQLVSGRECWRVEPRVIHTVLLVSARLQADVAAEEPGEPGEGVITGRAVLPPELWHMILGFLQRWWWAPPWAFATMEESMTTAGPPTCQLDDPRYGQWGAIPRYTPGVHALDQDVPNIGVATRAEAERWLGGPNLQNGDYVVRQCATYLGSFRLTVWFGLEFWART